MFFERNSFEELELSQIQKIKGGDGEVINIEALDNTVCMCANSVDNEEQKTDDTETVLIEDGDIPILG